MNQHPTDAEVLSAMRGTVANVLTVLLAAWAILIGGAMMVIPKCCEQPRFQRLELLLHGNIGMFGAVLFLAGLTKAGAAIAGWIRIRIAATALCGGWWLLNTMSQVANLNVSGDIIGVAGTFMVTALFMLFAIAQLAYLKATASNAP